MDDLRVSKLVCRIKSKGQTELGKKLLKPLRQGSLDNGCSPIIDKLFNKGL